MTDPLGPVVITTREIYDQLVRVVDALASFGTRLDRVADGQDEIKRDITENVKRDISDHEARLRSLERGRWPLPSLAAVVALAALAVAIIPLIR